MFSAHLIFGDIDKHSAMSFPLRSAQLEKFWDLCEQHKPQKINGNRHSFYVLDNDSLRVGLSNVGGLSDGIDVLKWVIGLQDSLAVAGIPVTFGVNLIACGHDINWVTYPGFVDRPDMIYISDETYQKYGSVQQPRLVGDGLIVASRLLDLAKRIPVRIAFSTFQGGHLYEGVEAIEKDPKLSHRIHVWDITSKFILLSREHHAWLVQHEVQAWGIENR